MDPTELGMEKLEKVEAAAVEVLLGPLPMVVKAHILSPRHRCSVLVNTNLETSEALGVGLDPLIRSMGLKHRHIPPREWC